MTISEVSSFFVVVRAIANIDLKNYINLNSQDKVNKEALCNTFNKKDRIY
jgi:hypothetical protein